MQGERVTSGNFDRLLWPPQRRGRGASRVRSVDMPTADLGVSREQGEWQVGTPLNRRDPDTMEERPTHEAYSYRLRNWPVAILSLCRQFKMYAPEINFP